MISVQQINDRVLSALDSENSDRYLFDQDIKPSLNGALEILVTWINQAFAENKLSAENLRELLHVGVWQANSYSRVAFNGQDVGHNLWSLLAIYPKPVVTSRNVVVPSTTNNSISKYRPDLSFVKSVQSAKRLTFEEWNENVDNAFMPGNSTLSGSLAEYAYLDAANYSSTSYPSSTDKAEWTIRPDIPNQLVAIAYLKYPTPVGQITDTIEFPLSLTDLIVELTLNKIGYKQGTQSVYVATAQNIAKLVSLIK